MEIELLNDTEVSMSAHAQLTKDFYRAFASGNKIFVENVLTNDFTFSAPPDPLLDKAGYFKKCWPGAGGLQIFTFVRIIEHGNEVIVTYELTQSNGTKGKNTEILTYVGNKVKRAEVYFGWTIE